MKNLTLIFACALSAMCGVNAQIFEINPNFPGLGGDSRSANWVDLNSDGHLDIFISNGPGSGENNFAFLGSGDGEFTNYDPTSPLLLDGSPSVGASFAEADIFEGLDVFVSTWYNELNHYYTWDGVIYQQVEVAPPADEQTYSETGAFGDADQDGLLELYVTNSAGSDDRNLYYSASDIGIFQQINEGVQVEDEGASRGVTWIDYDNDGDADIFVTNEDNTPNRLYENQGDGTFVSIDDDVLTTNAGASMSATWGDYNNDGYMDVFICNFGTNNRLYRNSPDGFVEITESIVTNDEGNSFSANWADVDNDGDLDLFVSNAFHLSLQPAVPLQNFLYINNGDETFTKQETDVVTQNMGWTYGNAFGDYDKDGDLDLLTANCFDGNETNRVYQNLTSDGTNAPAWIEIQCVGTISNPSAIGARVTIVAEINGQEVSQTREITSQSSYCGQNMLAAHFGLGDADVVEQIIIEWPNSPSEVYYDLDVNQYFIAVEGDAPLSVDDEYKEIDVLVFPNPAKHSFSCTFKNEDPGVLELNLYSINGKLVQSLYNGRVHSYENLSFQLSNKLIPGTYMVKGQLNQKLVSSKIIIQ